MNSKKDLDRNLGELLKSRPIPVDPGRMEGIRENILYYASGKQPRPAEGVFRRYRVAMATALVLAVAAVFAWRFDLVTPGVSPRLAGSRLLQVAENDEHLDYALVVLSGFTSKTSPDRPMIDLDYYDSSTVSSGGEVVYEMFYSAL